MAPTLTLAPYSSLLKRSKPYCDGYFCYSLPVPTLVAIIVGSVLFIAYVIILFLVVRWMRRRKALRKDAYTQQVLAAPSEPIASNPHAF
jgi:hypothetical protein